VGHLPLSNVVVLVYGFTGAKVLKLNKHKFTLKSLDTYPLYSKKLTSIKLLKKRKHFINSKKKIR